MDFKIDPKMGHEGQPKMDSKMDAKIDPRNDTQNGIKITSKMPSKNDPKTRPEKGSKNEALFSTCLISEREARQKGRKWHCVVVACCCLSLPLCRLPLRLVSSHRFARLARFARSRAALVAPKL